MRKLLIAAFVVCIGVSQSQASIFTDGTITHLQDADWESIVDDGDGILEAGDYLYGMWQIESIFGIDPDSGPFPSNEYTAVFLMEVASVADGGIYNGKQFTMKAAPIADWNTILHVTPTGGFGTIAMFYRDDDNSVDVTGTEATALASATDGTLMWDWGFTGTSGATAANEFWMADANTDVIGSLTSLSYTASMNTTNVYPAASGISPLDTHNYLNFGAAAQVQLEGGKASGSSGPFVIKSNTSIFIKAIPEPASLAIWSMLIGLGLVVARRRRR